MNGFYDEQWFDERWNSMPIEMRERAVAVAKDAISPDDLDLIRRKHAEFGPHEWIHYLIDLSPNTIEDMVAVGMGTPEQTTMSGHHFFGMAIRNRLRSAGLVDEDLPPAPYEGGQMVQNWDDHYVSVIEAAAGLRPIGE